MTNVTHRPGDRITSRRRILVAAGGLLCAPWTLAQAPKHARIGFLSAGSPATSNVLQFLVPALRESGWSEGRNLTIERRFAGGSTERLGKFAGELVALRPQAIVAQTNVDAKAARQATRTIPIVMMYALRPVENGLAQSLSHPGGNVTGVVLSDPKLQAKNVQLMKEALPGMKRLAYMYPAGADLEAYADEMEKAARALDVDFLRIAIKRPDEVRAALEAAKRQHMDALRVVTVGPVETESDQIIAFAKASRILSNLSSPASVEKGAFMCYLPSFTEGAARAAAIVDKILNGANPADIPMEYPTRYELTLNLKTAKELGISVPASLLQRADRVIE